MERLTNRIGEYVYYANWDYSKNIPAEYSPNDVGRILKALCAYESTNHTPEECAAAFEELAAYRAAEQDGTLLRMPCKQYTTIYYILDKTVYVGWYLAKAGQTTSLILQDRIEMGVCWCNDDSWFFTSEEAEITLKEQEAVNV